MATITTERFKPSGPKSSSMNSCTSRPRSPTRPITETSALVYRAIIDSSTDFPTPEPETFWPSFEALSELLDRLDGPVVLGGFSQGAVMSYAAISLPGEITFISSIAPIAMALGVLIAPLVLLVAVEMVPDIFRTVGNVTLDVAVTTAVDRSTADPPES